MWDASEDQLKAGDILAEKIFEYIEEYKEYLDERRTRQILKSMFVTWVILVDTDVDKSDSDRLLYDMYNKINEYTKCDFNRFEDLLTGLLV